MTKKVLNLPARSGKPPLALLDNAAKALAVCTRADAAKGIRDIAIAFQTYAKQAKDTVLVERATEVRVRAETRAGELLHDMAVQRKREARGGDRRSKLRGVTLKLDDLGITKMQASRWQKLAILKLAFPKDWDERLRRMCRMAIAAIEGDRAFINETRAQRNIQKKERRAERERDLADATERAAAALGRRIYGVLYADPPWRYNNPPMGDLARANEQHYPTMEIEEICALRIPAADDSVLFLWATIPMLPQALAVMSAWGFAYKSAIAWNKDKTGTGYWVRGQCELLLIGTRGNVPAPAPGEQLPAIVEAPRGRHSEKPECFADMIARLFPHVPKLEMFARRMARPGWDAWGNEAETDERRTA